MEDVQLGIDINNNVVVVCINNNNHVESFIHRHEFRIASTRISIHQFMIQNVKSCIKVFAILILFVIFMYVFIEYVGHNKIK